MPNTRSHRPYEPVELDRIGWRIIEELQQDARLSWAGVGPPRRPHHARRR